MTHSAGRTVRSLPIPSVGSGAEDGDSDESFRGKHRNVHKLVRASTFPNHVDPRGRWLLRNKLSMLLHVYVYVCVHVQIRSESGHHHRTLT